MNAIHLLEIKGNEIMDAEDRALLQELIDAGEIRSVMDRHYPSVQFPEARDRMRRESLTRLDHERRLEQRREAARVIITRS